MVSIMDGTGSLRYLCLILLPLLDFVEETAGVYCQYESDYGVEFTYCPEQCCGTQVNYREDACCEYTHSNGVYIGASLGTMILVGVIFLCLTYLCCRQRILQRAREQAQGNFNTRTRRARGQRGSHFPEPIPTVSINVEPIQPPPYESLDLPPPYYPESGPSQNKQEDKSYLDHPPPAYTQKVEDDK